MDLSLLAWILHVGSIAAELDYWTFHMSGPTFLAPPASTSSSHFPLPLSFLLPCHSLTYVSRCLHTARLSVCNLQAPHNDAGLQAASVAVYFSYVS